MRAHGRGGFSRICAQQCGEDGFVFFDRGILKVLPIADCFADNLHEGFVAGDFASEAAIRATRGDQVMKAPIGAPSAVGPRRGG